MEQVPEAVPPAAARSGAGRQDRVQQRSNRESRHFERDSEAADLVVAVAPAVASVAAAVVHLAVADEPAVAVVLPADAEAAGDKPPRQQDKLASSTAATRLAR